MLNQVVLVGRLTDDVSIKNTENKKKRSSIVLAVQRGFKNSDGLYECDFIRCTLWNAIAENTSKYCEKGDVVGIKGRLQSNCYTDQDNETKFSIEVVAEKVTFLSSKKSEDVKIDNK